MSVCVHRHGRLVVTLKAKGRRTLPRRRGFTMSIRETGVSPPAQTSTTGFVNLNRKPDGNPQGKRSTRGITATHSFFSNLPADGPGLDGCYVLYRPDIKSYSTKRTIYLIRKDRQGQCHFDAEESPTCLSLQSVTRLLCQ